MDAPSFDPNSYSWQVDDLVVESTERPIIKYENYYAHHEDDLVVESTIKPTIRIAAYIMQAQPEVIDSTFDGLPNRRHSIMGRDSENYRVYIAQVVGLPKLYRCRDCHDLIEIGSTHAIIRIIQESRRYDHHHIHSKCVDSVLNTLSSKRVISSKETQKKTLDKRNKRHRYKQRRNSD